MGIFDDIAAKLAAGAEEEFLRPMLRRWTAQFVQPPGSSIPGITQQQADVAVAGDLVDAKIALVLWLRGQTPPPP